jgi:regulator of PEP synthase PpsR (kinase-PPPase family)
LYGLSIDPNRLAQIRTERRPNSRYAALEQCRWEVEVAERIYRREGIPSLNTTHTSIEEIASKILQSLGLNRQLY